MQILPQQVMGYDRATSVFSPDGRLLQVEYAKKAVSQGAMAIGIVCRDAVLLMADRRIVDSLIVRESVKKIFEIDKHIVTTASGLISDARVLVKKCRVYAQQYRLTYGKGIDIESLIKYISDMEQLYTQYGGIRPFGISFLMASVDKLGPKLFVTEPSGIYFSFKAQAIGVGSAEANKILERKYRAGLKLEEGARLAKAIFKRILGKDFSAARLEVAAVTSKGIQFLDVEKIK